MTYLSFFVSSVHRQSQVAFEAGVGVGCNPGPDLLFGSVGEGIATKIDLLESSLLGNELHQKVDVALSFLSSEP